MSDPTNIAGDIADTLAHEILGAHCACYAEAWPAHTCANEADAVARMIRARLAALREENARVADDVASEIVNIMRTYREQEASSYGVDTPGGLEHMGDVWKLLSKWDKRIRETRAARS